MLLSLQWLVNKKCIHSCWLTINMQDHKTEKLKRRIISLIFDNQLLLMLTFLP